ncbi:MAG: (Fe-S)-binding protein [Nocardioidaceae bacterium]
MQVFAIIASLTIAVIAIALFGSAIVSIVGVIQTGQPVVGRRDHQSQRWLTMAKETLGHTRMLQWSHVGIAHWFVFIGFGFLFFTLLTAVGQLFDAEFALPLIGHWVGYEWLSEAITWLMLASILALIAIRLSNAPRGPMARYSRFSGSRMWQGYFVEAVIVGVALCILVLRGAEYALQGDDASRWHFPTTFFIGEALGSLSTTALANLVYGVAMLKIVISFTWMIVLARNTTMGVAWHRFSVWPNIWFKRFADGRPSLGGLEPMMAGGKPIDFENIDELDEETAFGIGKVEDFTWKGMLDFASCTECGRCQSQCPAWNTEKPLSPKLFITNLRDHAYAKAPLFRLAERRAPVGMGMRRPTYSQLRSGKRSGRSSVTLGPME